MSFCTAAAPAATSAEAGAVASVGFAGDCDDSAPAEAFTSETKPKLARKRGPWQSIDDPQIATTELID